jgi:hypothetical protein
VLLAAAAGDALAQRVPEVNDVYTIRPPAARLGPDSEPARVVERFGRLLGEFPALRYDFRLDPADPAPLGGTMILDSTNGRWRAALEGRDAAGDKLIATVAFDGSGYALTDLAQDRTVTASRASELGALGSLAAVVLPSWPRGAERFTWLGQEEVAGEPCHRVHFVDATRGEHVYAWLSLRDALPRRLERVGPDTAGRVRVVGVAISNPAFQGVLPPELR